MSGLTFMMSYKMRGWLEEKKFVIEPEGCWERMKTGERQRKKKESGKTKKMQVEMGEGFLKR